MRRNHALAAVTAGLLAFFAGNHVAHAQAPLACGPFTQDVVAAPEPREAAVSRARFEHIKDAANARSYPLMFLGDSLTQRWDEVAEDHRIWERYFEPLGALNAGIDGDRTEHLLWRIEHGNLENQRPHVAVVLIGTNDLGHGRSPEDAAEGVRQVLLKLRHDLPGTRILLQALWPRNDLARLSLEIGEVNTRISQCQDGAAVIYQDAGRALLDAQGRLSRAIMPDGLHPSPTGYQIVSPAIAQELARLLAAR